MPREFADPYVYPGTDVLKNKPGLRDSEALRRFEYEQTASRAAELQASPAPGKFDLQHLKAIHKHLFQDVYAWAGEARTVNIAKGGDSFASPAFVESYTGKLAADLAKENHLKGLDKPQFVERLAHHFSEFNAVHPFREGNGRATREFFAQLSKEAGYELDQTRIRNDAGQWNRASAAAFKGDPQPLKQILDYVVRPERAVAFERDAPADALRTHPELKGAFMTLKAAEVYAASAVGDQAARAAFMTQIRARISGTLHAGQLVDEPKTKTHEQGRDR